MWNWHRRLLPGQGERAACHLLVRGNSLAFGEEKDGINGVRIVDVVGGDPRGIRSTTRLRFNHLVEEASLGDIRGEHSAFAYVLIANG